jgi:alpha-tubulin suppressor-like RCC1 family protein
MPTYSPSNFLKDDPITGTTDLFDEYMSDSWLVEQFVGNSLLTCGYSRGGTLGIGDSAGNVHYSSPVQVGSLNNWKQVACGYATMLGIKTDGSLWGWGFNVSGELGNASGASYSSPVQIGALTNWKQISLDNSSYAIKTDGTLWSAGVNGNGQLGIGSTTAQNSWVQIGSLTGWKQVAAAKYAMTAIRNDGTLWACGYNTYGNLGQNDRTSRSSPVQIGALTNWKQVSGGTPFQPFWVATKTDGTLWGCGYNQAGTLGIANNQDVSSPVQVGSLTN